MLERLLVAGLGSIGTRHISVVRQLVPGIRIVALRHGATFGEPVLGIDQSVTNIGEALAFRPQAALIANPSSHHLDVAVPLARAGVHLLVEKPLSNSTEGVSELIRECSTHGATLLTGYNLRFSRSLQCFAELVAKERVGRALYVKAEVGQWLPTWRPGVDYRSTVSARMELGGGVLLELSHEIDYLRWLFGDVQTVSAHVFRLSLLEMNAEDTAHLVMTFAPKSTPSKSLVACLTMDCVRKDTSRVCTIVCEEGTLRWNGVTGSVELYESREGLWQTLFSDKEERNETYEAEWRHFMSCISNGSKPAVSGEDGLAVLRIIEAARLSAAKGITVPVCQREKEGQCIA